MSTPTEALLKQVTEDVQRLQVEVNRLEQTLAKKRADLLMNTGAVQALQLAITREKEAKDASASA